MPIRQGSNRPVLAVRDCVPTLMGSSSLYAPAFATEAEREGMEGREKIAFYCLSIYWQIAHPPPPNSLTMVHLVWTACSVPRPTKYPHLQRSCGGKGDCPLHCTPTIAHCYLLHQATSASLQALNTLEQAGKRNTCNHTHVFTSIRLSLLAINKQTQSGKYAASEHNFIPAPCCSQRRWDDD